MYTIDSVASSCLVFATTCDVLTTRGATALVAFHAAASACVQAVHNREWAFRRPFFLTGPQKVGSKWIVAACVVFVSVAPLPALTSDNHAPQVLTHVPSEMPEYTIAHEYQKHRALYSYIEPIDPEMEAAVHCRENIVYDTRSSKSLAMDVCIPSKSTSSLTVLLIHGGGWRSGHRSHLKLLAKRLAEKGFSAATVDYRTSKVALYPAGLEDIEEAMRWLKGKLQLWQVPHDRFALLGASSGAHMASLLGARLGQVDQELPIAAVVNLDGIVETTSIAVRKHEDRPNKVSYLALWLGGRYADVPDLWQEVSPLHALGDHPPATLFINSSIPRFHAGRGAYLNHLEQHQTFSHVVEIPDTPHTFWLFEPWFSNVVAETTSFLQRVDARHASASNLSPIRPRETLNLARVLTLTDAQRRDDWRAYFENSVAMARSDVEALQSEGKDALAPVLARRRYRYDNRQSYSPQDLRALLSFQTPSGGWGKNTEFLSQPRSSGQGWSIEMDYAPTFDNGATTSELRVLLNAWDQRDRKVESSINRALNLILSAQMPSGGWPQSYPLRGGYHNWHTYNDGVTANILHLLMDIQEHSEGFHLDLEWLNRIDHAVMAGLSSIVNDQVWLDEHTGAWGQQHDPINHYLTGARSYELPVLATAETAGLVSVLKRRANAHPKVKSATAGAIAWLQRHRLIGVRWQRPSSSGSGLVAYDKALGLWPRFIDPKSQTAVFAGRDGIRRASVTELSVERQQGYGWYTTAPSAVLDTTR